MWIPARASLAAAATIAGLLGALASGPPASAAVREQADPAAAGCADVLAIAGRYGEFTAGDNRRGPGGRGAAGAVAVGGNAGFPGGSTVGRDLGAAEARALPGGNALIVAGDVTGGVRVLHGNGVHGGTLAGRAEAPAGTIAEGPSPVDFAAEFAALRRVSAALAEAGQSSAAQWRALGPLGLAGADGPTGPTGSTGATRSTGATGASLRFTGTDVRYNSFVVPAAELEKAAEIRLAVPVGATTVITVEGAGYRQGTAGATRFLLWDEREGREVPESTSGSAAGGVIRSKLLWNLPGAARVVKDGAAAWPGSILAPDADVDLGTGDGPVNGSVIARSLTGAGGAGTRHHPFSGCLPRVPEPVGPGAAPGTPDPAGTVTGPTPADRPLVPPSGSPSGSPSEAAPGSSTAPDRAPTAAPDGSAASSASAGPRIEGRGGGPGGGLARTGGGVVTVELAVGGGAVLATGTAMVLVARRRRA
ncbi:choice-of-anchor A family protein [Streptomyces sp. NPDC002044]|uniref:choice-of-anchor A family protein n=1 Tax=Streptomyces sp. NPDC002044 TaxID=3154662 RepID=UPI003317A224